MNPHPKGTMLHAHWNFTHACRGLVRAFRDARPWWLIWRTPPIYDGPRTMRRLDHEVRFRLGKHVARAAQRFAAWFRP